MRTGRDGGWGRTLMAILAAATLAGCAGGATDDSDAVDDLAAGPVGDVPAPEIFTATAEGLWDGRPSLGGVWVAHPEVDDPQRALIVNAATGAEVVGALFRREREAPGPVLQVSSEAAEGLGILAGQPTELRVVALRPGADDAGPAPEIDDAAPSAEDPLAADVAGALADDAPTPVPVTAGLDRPFVQIGIFSVESNARDAAAGLRDVGISPAVRREGDPDAPYWRVVAGPVTTDADRTRLLDEVRDLGFADAYAVTD